MTLPPALNAEQLEECLDEHVDAVLSSRRTAKPAAQRLAVLPREQQNMLLRWVGIVAKTNAELAYQVAYYAASAAARLDDHGVETWILKAIDVFDKTGLHDAIADLETIDAFAEQHQRKVTGLALEDVSGVLQHVVRGLSGRPLQVTTGEYIYTDTETIYLPRVLSEYPQRDDNFRLYKAMAVYLWAQTWYGTTGIDWSELYDGQLAAGASRQQVLVLFHALESIRLDACIQRDLPGIHRDMAILRSEQGALLIPTAWQSICQALLSPGSTVQTSIALMPQVDVSELPPPVIYQGVLRPEEITAVRQQRIENDKQQLQKTLRNLINDPSSGPRATTLDLLNTDKRAGDKLTVRVQAQDYASDNIRVDIELDGIAIIPPDDLKSAIRSILQDLSEIPEDYLVPAGDGAYDAQQQTVKNPDDVWCGGYHEEGAYLYNEWDHERHHYRKNWAVLREKDSPMLADTFVDNTLKKYSGYVAQLKRTFEAIRGEEKRLKKQVHGDDVDIDATVEAFADIKSGLELTDRLYTRLHKVERNLAVIFMVDMSGSTKGWINDAEREALVLLCEALESLGDQYAIYGFSGFTRKKCELFNIKQFDEPYNNTVRARISGIRPQDYTRMGVFIRHLSNKLNTIAAKTKLLITLSDGKPDDLDGYRGEYGIEDTRQALLEAKRTGIHPYCITIDKEAIDYLPHMYGAVNYSVIDDVKKLPLKVSDIYRKLTT